jgi:hypothetical protein
VNATVVQKIKYDGSLNAISCIVGCTDRSPSPEVGTTDELG